MFDTGGRRSICCADSEFVLSYRRHEKGHFSHCQEQNDVLASFFILEAHPRFEKHRPLVAIHKPWFCVTYPGLGKYFTYDLASLPKRLAVNYVIHSIRWPPHPSSLSSALAAGNAEGCKDKRKFVLPRSLGNAMRKWLSHLYLCLTHTDTCTSTKNKHVLK